MSDNEALDGDEEEMTPEEWGELLAAIDRGLEQVARGETISADELRRRLRET